MIRQKIFYYAIFLIFLFPSFSMAAPVLILSNQTHSFYADIDTAKNIRYDPPYYTIEGVIISQDYTNNTTTPITYRFMYNIQNINVQARIIKAYSYVTSTHEILYNYDYINDGDITTVKNKNSTLGITADLYFKHFYTKPFYDMALDYQFKLVMEGKI